METTQTTEYQEWLVALALVGEASKTPEDIMIREEDREALKSAIRRCLVLRELMILRLRFGWHEEDWVDTYWEEVLPYKEASIPDYQQVDPMRKNKSSTKIVVYGRLGEPLSLDEIGCQFGISPRRVRQIIQQALVKLRGSIPAHCLLTMLP